MENNEIFTDETVDLAVEEISEGNSGSGLAIVAGAGIAVITGVVAWKYVIKPLVKKLKTKKAQKETENCGETEEESHESIES